MSGTAAIEVRGLRREFRVRQGLFAPAKRVIAVDDVSFSVPAGSVLGVVGESGCGKSTLARLILGLLPPTCGRCAGGWPAPGRDGPPRPRAADPAGVPGPLRLAQPQRRVRDIVAMPLIAQGNIGREDLTRRVGEALERVGLSIEQGERYPSQLSGGQRQRVAIARALVLRPRIVVCDEPTSALDVTVQAQILNLLAELRRDLGLTYLFISHNLAVVEHIASEVAVMYLGRIVERAETETLFAAPRHPYTQGAAGLGADARAGPRRARCGPGRRHARPGEYPAGLPLPSALPGRPAAVFHRHADARARCRWPGGMSPGGDGASVGRAVGARQHHHIAVGVAQPDFPVARIGVAVARQDHGRSQRADAGHGGIEIRHLEPQQHAIAARHRGVRDRAVMMVDADVMQLQDDVALRVHQPLILRPAMGARAPSSRW